MGGTINLVSQINNGTCFYFSLPLKVGDEEKIDYFDGLHTQLPALRILVVDDIEQNTELLSLLLSRDHHAVTKASNGLEAIDTFKQHDFDVILMDIAMPNMDGIEACAAIRSISDSHKSTVPVIAFTANASRDLDEKIDGVDFDGLVKKPSLTQDILDEIDAVIERRACLKQ